MSPLALAPSWHELPPTSRRLPSSLLVSLNVLTSRSPCNRSVVLQPGQTLTQNTAVPIQITNISVRPYSRPPAFGPLQLALTLPSPPLSQYGAEVKGSARSAVILKYPEFEQQDEDEDDSEDEDEEGDGDIKLPEIITKETVLAVLRPNSVRFLRSHCPSSRCASRR